MAEGDITTDDGVWLANFEEHYLPAVGERMGPGEAPKPNALIHISIGTDKNFEKMIEFYMKFFNAHVVNYRDKRDAGGGRAAFLSWDARDHRFAILERAGSTLAKGRAGFAHGAFLYDSLADLVRLYRQCKSWGIEIDHCINHGQSTSFYYTDPDGNEIEAYIDNFDTPEECTHFKHWLQYRPGLDYDMGAGAFDPEKMAALVDEGIDEKILRDRDEVIRLKAEGKL
ncbi:MAG: VOC family protein [Alphaproteobacteria bacterium]|nr:VOC family protein [Alphaproteobacteria bacterium]MCZ6813345.1 VOC family protein [Alphaproteobacteria bacterium]